MASNNNKSGKYPIPETSNDPDLDPVRDLAELKTLLLNAYDEHNIVVE